MRPRLDIGWYISLEYLIMMMIMIWEQLRWVMRWSETADDKIITASSITISWLNMDQCHLDWNRLESRYSKDDDTWFWKIWKKDWTDKVYVFKGIFLKKNIEERNNLKWMDLNNLVPIMIMIEKLCPLHFSCWADMMFIWIMLECYHITVSVSLIRVESWCQPTSIDNWCSYKRVIQLLSYPPPTHCI